MNREQTQIGQADEGVKDRPGPSAYLGLGALGPRGLL